MKGRVSLVIIALIMQLQCGGSCLAASFASGAAAAATSEPPCHQHHGNPSNNQTPKHDGSSACGHGPLVQLQSSGGVTVVLEQTAILPATVQTAFLHGSAMSELILQQPSHSSSPPVRFSILRI